MSSLSSKLFLTKFFKPSSVRSCQRSCTILKEQQEYYNKRSNEYDHWWYRIGLPQTFSNDQHLIGRFDRSPETNTQWFQEVKEAEKYFQQRLPKNKNIIEFASGNFHISSTYFIGTGIWTEKLLDSSPSSLTCVDGSKEMIQVSAKKLSSHPNWSKVSFLTSSAKLKAKYTQADLFQYKPSDNHDIVFFGFWMSHIPPEQFDSFFTQVVAKSLKPQGHVLFIDSLSTLDSSADRKVNSEHIVEKRMLNDGSKYSIVKVRFEKKTVLINCNRFIII